MGCCRRLDRYIDLLINCELIRLKLAPVSMRIETSVWSGRVACAKHAVG